MSGRVRAASSRTRSSSATTATWYPSSSSFSRYISATAGSASMKRTRMSSSLRSDVEGMAAPSKLGRSAYLRPQYVVCRRLSMMREVLRLLGGLGNFLRKLVPADAIAHPGAQLPFERLRPPVDPGPELIETLADSAGVDVEIPHGIAYATRVELQGPVQPPVLGRQPCQVDGVDGIVVMVRDRMIEQQCGRVDEVFHVDLIDL